MPKNKRHEEKAQRLRDLATNLTPGAYAGAINLLANDDWNVLEGAFWNSAHPMPLASRAAMTNYQEIALLAWHKCGIGQSNPIALYRNTLESTAAVEAAMRILARIYTGCNLGYCSPPSGFWRTVYALTASLLSPSNKSDPGARQRLLHQCMQIWLMAWINPLSLPPGRLPIAVRLVGILSKISSFTMTSPTHAGSGLAVADLMSDSAPMSFARVPATWTPTAPLYINAQDAAFTIRELASTTAIAAQRDAFDALMQAGTRVGLTTQEVQSFVRRALRKFAYTNVRNIPRVGRNDTVEVVIGLIDVWSALQQQTLPAGGLNGFTSHPATILNHSESGFLLQLTLDRPLLSVESLIGLRGHQPDPWTLAAVRWLEDFGDKVLLGCEVLSNYAVARVAQTPRQMHSPIISFRTDKTASVLLPTDLDAATTVTQLTVDSETWVITPALDTGEDWQASDILDVIEAPR